MSRRAHHRSVYGEAWETMDAEKMISALADGFVLNDPAVPQPVTKATLAAYLAGWDERTKAAGATGKMEISDMGVIFSHWPPPPNSNRIVLTSGPSSMMVAFWMVVRQAAPSMILAARSRPVVAVADRGRCGLHNPHP